MIRYRVDGGMTAPKAVECGDRDYPDRDDDGLTIYDNTHYTTESEAWAWLDRDCDAAISITARLIIEARATLRRFEGDAADAVVRRATINRRRKEWEEREEPRG